MLKFLELTLNDRRQRPKRRPRLKPGECTLRPKSNSVSEKRTPNRPAQHGDAVTKRTLSEYYSSEDDDFPVGKSYGGGTNEKASAEERTQAGIHSDDRQPPLKARLDTTGRRSSLNSTRTLTAHSKCLSAGWSKGRTESEDRSGGGKGSHYNRTDGSARPNLETNLLPNGEGTEVSSPNLDPQLQKILGSLPLPLEDELESTFESTLELQNLYVFDCCDEEFGRKLFEDVENPTVVEAVNECLVQAPTADQSDFHDEDKFHLIVQRDEGFDSYDEEFGKQDFAEKSFYIVEAYNNVGDELIITEVCVKHGENAGCSATEETDGRLNSIVDNSDPSVVQFISNLKDQCEEEENVPVHTEITRAKIQALQSKSELDRNNNNLDSVDSFSGDCQSADSNKRGGSCMKPFNSQNRTYLIIKELLETEKVYVDNLGKVIKNYYNFFPKDSKLEEIFGNITEIYKKTKDFYKVLCKCNYDYRKISEAFLSFKHLFNLYPEYSRNKPKSDKHMQGSLKELAIERQKKIKDRLNLSSYLLNPVQRLGRYILLLEGLQKSIDHKCDVLVQATELVRQTMKKGNDLIAIESILDCPVDLTTKGNFIMREKFNLLKPKRAEIMLFLFEDMVVFTTENPDNETEKNLETFSYLYAIGMSDLALVPIEGENQIFHLKNYTKCKKGKSEHYTYILETKNVKAQKKWIEVIEARLWKEFHKFKENPIKKAASIPTKSSTLEKKGPKKNSRDARKNAKRRSKFYDTV